MIRQFVYFDTGKEVITLQEPTIYDTYMIQHLLSGDQDYPKKNAVEVLKILGIEPKKHYLLVTAAITEKATKCFNINQKKGSGRDYFLGICGILAHHNHLDLQTFIKTYCMSQIPELFKVFSYYWNEHNNKSSENVKFYDKHSFSKDDIKEMEHFITEMTKND